MIDLGGTLGCTFFTDPSRGGNPWASCSTSSARAHEMCAAPGRTCKKPLSLPHAKAGATRSPLSSSAGAQATTGARCAHRGWALRRSGWSARRRRAGCGVSTSSMARWTGERAGRLNQPSSRPPRARPSSPASSERWCRPEPPDPDGRQTRGLPRLPSSPPPRAIPPCDGSGVRIASNAVASPQRHVQHVGEDRAPDAVDGLLQKRESLALAF